MSDDRVVIGRVGKAHGLKGEVVVTSTTDVADRFDVGASVFLDGRAAVVTASRPHQGKMLVRFDDTPDRNAAELLRGVEVTAEVRGSDASDVWFVHELVGMTVADEEGNVLGVVTEHIELPAIAGYGLLEVTAEDGTTWLLPDSDELVEVATDPTDETNYLMVIDPPEGLLPGTEMDVVMPVDESDAGVDSEGDSGAGS